MLQLLLKQHSDLVVQGIYTLYNGQVLPARPGKKNNDNLHLA